MKKLIFGIIFALFSLSAFAAVDINTANLEELQTLTGIGPDKAKAIIDYRTKNGPFETVGDLQKVSGIGAKTMEKLGDSITVSGGGKATKKENSASGKGK